MKIVTSNSEAIETEYPYALVNDENTVYADSLTDLVGEIIEGYDDIPDTEEGHGDALLSRYAYLLNVARWLQTGFIEANEDLVRDLPDDALTAVMQDKTIPFAGLDNGSVEWEYDLPLILVATDYAPFTSRPTPSGNVFLVDPSTELTFLQNLDEVDLIDFLVKED